MKKIGCFGWLVIWLMGVGVIAAFGEGGNPIWALPALIFVVAIVAGVFIMQRSKNKDHSAELLAVAGDLEAWVAAGLDAEGNPFDADDEQLLFVLPNVELLEYKSTGSTYSGGSAGVSFPLFGRVRGNVGGNRGSFSRNPEELILSDLGRLKVSTERLIYVGEKESREIDLDKVLDFELGPNGLWVKLAMSNRSKREGFQSIGIAKEFADKGLDAAKLYAKNLAADIRATIAAEAAAKSRK
jgi:hypothetical protein